MAAGPDTAISRSASGSGQPVAAGIVPAWPARFPADAPVLAPGVSVVVPVHNGAPTLESLVARVEAALRSMGCPFELILVDDHSQDASWSQIRGLAVRHGWIRGVRLVRNFGQHGATLCGLDAARYELVVTLDDDLQHPPEAISELVGRLGGECELVYALPVISRQPWHHRLLGSAGRAIVAGAALSRSPFAWSGFRALRTSLRESLVDSRGEIVLDVALSRAARQWQRVDFEMAPRQRTRYHLGTRIGLVATAVASTAGRTLALGAAANLGLAVLTLAALALLALAGGLMSDATLRAGAVMLGLLAALWLIVQSMVTALLVLQLRHWAARSLGPTYRVLSTADAHAVDEASRGGPVPIDQVGS